MTGITVFSVHGGGGAGTVTGTGATPQTAYWTGATSIGGDAGLTVDVANNFYVTADAGGLRNDSNTARVQLNANGSIQADAWGDARGSYAVDWQMIRTAVDTRVASGAYAFIAGGRDNTASGDYSYAEGRTNIASGDWSHAEGNSNTASGDYSHAEGNSTEATNFWAHAEGFDTIASGEVAHAEGAYTTASGNRSHSECYGTTASGNNAHAEGDRTIAGAGAAAHAEGSLTTASGSYSHAEGSATTASGFAAHAEGANTVAAGDRSYAGGRRAIINAAHDGTFLWGDGTDADFNSAAVNEFAIRARGGFRHAYDNNYYFSRTVASDGDTVFNITAAAGTPTFTFSRPVILSSTLQHEGATIGFYSTAPIARQVLATGVGATVDNVITALQNLGLVSQI